MGAKVITLFPELTEPKPMPKSKATLFPDEVPDVWIQRLEADFAEEYGTGIIDVSYAIRTCRDWSHGSGKTRINWVAVIRNGVRKGWLRPDPNNRPQGTANTVRDALKRLRDTAEDR